MIDPKLIAKLCKALSVEKRVRMLALLRERAYCVNAIARLLEITPAAVSQHLRILRDLDLVEAKKSGYFVHYKVDHNSLTRLMTLLNNLLTPPEES